MRFEDLWLHKGFILETVSVSTLYLSIVDFWGISHGTWHIDDTLFDVYPGFPFEEFIFFVVTSLMCSCGYVAFMTEPKPPKEEKKVE